VSHESLVRQIREYAKTLINFFSNFSSLVIAKHISNLVLESHGLQLILTLNVSINSKRAVSLHIPNNTLQKIPSVTSFADADQSRNFHHHAITAGF